MRRHLQTLGQYAKEDVDKWLMPIVGKKIPEIYTTTNAPSLLIVRHPFERIVSAFREKIERTHGTNRWYINKYSKYIIQRYRKRANCPP